jgi:peptidoglycan hydrolase CwlO-like protein
MNHLRRAAASFAVAAGLLTALVSPALSQSSGQDARRDREEVRSKRAEVASSVDALEADEATVERALSDLDANLRTQRAAYGDAERAYDEAATEVDRLDEEIQAAEREIGELRERLRRFAIDAYIRPPSDQGFEVFETENATDGVVKDALMADRSGQSRDVVEQLRAAEAALAEQRDQAEVAKSKADDRRQQLDARIDELNGARTQQADFAAQVESRLNARLVEADQLASMDAQLSDEISRQEAALAEQLRRSRPSSPGGASSGGSPGGGGPIVSVPVSGELVSVRGIVVHQSIAGQLEGLLGAADADGVSLSGNGYRDINRQIELRRQNCGSSEYAIWQMSPDSCNPPTAIPGRSMHERGLAIDFAFNGQLIRSRSSAGFQWMAANAPRYGFTNLPSEPWHWSANGQ